MRAEQRDARRPFTVPLLVGATLIAGALACAVVAEDGAKLSELSREQMMSLCDELRDATPGPDAAVTCADGWTATVYTPSNQHCGYPRYYGKCEATAGDMRACAEAVRRDPCAAIDAPPPECAPFYASACLPWLTASPVTAECPSADPEALTALEGIYEIVSHTRSNSCEADGESVLTVDTQPFVVVVASINVVGEQAAVLQSCTTLASCREAAALMRASAAVPGPLDAGDEAELKVSVRCLEGHPATYSGHRFDFPASIGECRMIDTKTVVSRVDPSSLRLDTQIWEAIDPDGPNGCYYGSGNGHSSAGDCTGAEAREVRFVAAL